MYLHRDVPLLVDDCFRINAQIPSGHIGDISLLSPSEAELHSRIEDLDYRMRCELCGAIDPDERIEVDRDVFVTTLSWFLELPLEALNGLYDEGSVCDAMNGENLLSYLGWFSSFVSCSADDLRRDFSLFSHLDDNQIFDAVSDHIADDTPHTARYVCSSGHPFLLIPES